MPRVKPLPKYIFGLAVVGALAFVGWKAMDKIPAPSAPAAIVTPAPPTEVAVPAKASTTQTEVAPPASAPSAAVDPGLARALEAGKR